MALTDVAVLRAEAGVFGSVASDPTVSWLVDTVAADADRALKAINGARAVARATVRAAWRASMQRTTTRAVTARW